MTEMKYKNVTVRIRGSAEREKVEEATINYLKKVLRCKSKRKNVNGKN